jgi:hypothetical protein
MAHFAKLNENKEVIDIVVIDNSELLDEAGNEIEQKGIDFCKSLFGQETIWVQTSYNGSFRKNYAFIGGVYDSQRDAFIGVKTYPSWVLNEETCTWQASIAYPEDGKYYIWNEDMFNWKEVAE